MNRILLLSLLVVAAYCQAPFLKKRPKTILEGERDHESKTLDDELALTGSLLPPQTDLKQEKTEVQDLGKEITEIDEKDDTEKAVDELEAKKAMAQVDTNVEDADAQAQAIEAKTEEQKDAMDEERQRYERQARVAAQEVKAALDAHGEFAEALKNEQSLLMSRVQEALQQEATSREGLNSHVGGLEMDMQKVKGHLPILFASPSAFR